VKHQTRTFRISEPCEADWNKMQPNAQGRHCELCVKSVFDLKGKTQDEISKIYSSEKGSLCARMLVESSKTKNLKTLFRHTRKLLAMMALFQLWIDHLFAQTLDDKGQAIFQKDSAKQIAKPLTLSGNISDSLNGEALPFATIKFYRLNGTLISGTYSNFDGHYSISIQEDIPDKISLQISAIGYQNRTIEVDIQRKTELSFQWSIQPIKLLEQEIISGRISMGIMYTPKPPIQQLKRTSNTKTYSSEDLEKYNFGR
jgi:hypothetical protein